MRRNAFFLLQDFDPEEERRRRNGGRWFGTRGNATIHGDRISRGSKGWWRPAKWHSYVTVVPSGGKSRSRLAAEKLGNLHLSDPLPSFAVNNSERIEPAKGVGLECSPCRKWPINDPPMLSSRKLEWLTRNHSLSYWHSILGRAYTWRFANVSFTVSFLCNVLSLWLYFFFFFTFPLPPAINWIFRGNQHRIKR